MKSTSQIPRHVAIIMDGNGRWAKQRGKPRFFGHVKGARQVDGIVRESAKLGVKVLTVFAFSTENWERPELEKQVLMRIFKKYLLRNVAELKEQNVRLRVLGQREKIPSEVKPVVEFVENELREGQGLQLNIAFSYGSRAEIIHAVRQTAIDVAAGRVSPIEIDQKYFEKKLWTSDLGALSDVDLVIRTSGEVRTSNFLLWQAAYAEYTFTDTYWPDFEVSEYREIIEDFSKRERRYGQVIQHDQSNHTRA